MKYKLNRKGFTLLEVLVASGIFLLFAVGIYGGVNLVFKIVYQSRMKILETAVLSEYLEVARNLPYDQVGTEQGVPQGALPDQTTTVRNGQGFIINTTVRNIDDSYDGTLGGTPNDTAPADYKLVEISAICNNCSQQTPVILSTIVAPKQLEGASKNGALFIQVFDYLGQPVAGASVTVTNTAQTPNLVIHDVTDNSGYLRIIDAPTATMSYYINVTKAGYSSDYTVPVSVSVPTPVKPPSNLVSQAITDISFSIDRLSSMNLHFLTPACVAVPNQQFTIRGEKIIGTDANDANIYKYNKTLTADGSGNYNFSNIEWDTYHVTIGGVVYNIGGSTPLLPFEITPGLSQDASIILQPYSANSLLVKVKDAGTGLPLSDATVHLTATGYDESRTTGYGFIRQTDWSGGTGQASYTNQTKYFTDNNNIKNNSPAGDLKLKKTGNSYANSGSLESSTFDLGTPVNFNNLIFSPLSQPVQTGANPITFQLATSNSSSPASWSYKGPDGTASTYYTATSTVIWSGHNGNRYLRYKVFLNTADTSYTPTLSEVAFTYTTSCVPPGQVFLSGLSAATYTLEVSRAGYISNNDTIDVSGATEAVVYISPAP